MMFISSNIQEDFLGFCNNKAYINYTRYQDFLIYHSTKEENNCEGQVKVQFLV